MCISLRGKVSQDMGSYMLNGAGKVEKDMVKIETFNSLFVLFLTVKIFLQESQTLEIREKVWNNKDLHSVEEDNFHQYMKWTYRPAGYSLL